MDETIETLRTRRDATLEAADAIIATADDEGRKVTPEENGKFETLMKEFEELRADVARREKFKAAKDNLAEVQRAIEPEGPATREDRMFDRIETMPVHHRKELKAFGEGSRQQRENAYRAGQWIKGHLFGIGDSKDWCREHGVAASEHRVMVEGVNSAGGALVPDEFEAAVINLRDAYGLARQECQIWPMTSDTLIVPRQTGDLSPVFVGENTPATGITASDLELSQVQLVARKLATLTRLSTDLIDDSPIDLAAYLADNIAWSFAKKEDQCLIDGDGTSTYGGITGIRAKMVDGNHAASYITATANDDQFVELLLADIVSTIAIIPQYAEGNARWFMSNYAWGAAVARLLAALAGNAMQNVNAGMEKEFMGYPVKLHPALPSATTAYNLVVMIIFGDMRKACAFGDRRGIRVKTLVERYAEFDQIAIQATERFDIVAHSLGDGTNAGPLVGFRGQT